jgi:hypothetical protein
MNRILLSAALLAALMLTAPGGVSAPAEQKHDMHIDPCAKECAHCMMECESCARHCADMLRKGQAKHEKTLGTCADCGDLCGVAAKVVARKGPLAVNICESCAGVCDACAKACEEFPADEHMKRCAKACRDCGKACREMVKRAGEHVGTKRTEK